eukprot:TRINITY_DN10236_c0_g2_i1.p1 TRINITY_DN10236_c0_g2~~TRINITY_DN10236_c0_g2_i1.p1  ORF type:complete len:290 (+),score=34.42 TRINITY_DN10236_c0_g2_i1:1-870(+)
MSYNNFGVPDALSRPQTSDRKPRPPTRVVATRQRILPLSPKPVLEGVAAPPQLGLSTVPRPRRPSTKSSRRPPPSERAVEQWTCVCSGPGSALVQDALRSRPRWKVLARLDAAADVLSRSPAQLMWVQHSRMIWWAERRAACCMQPSVGKQLLNVFEAEGELTNPALLYKNLQSFCGKWDVPVDKYVPELRCISEDDRLDSGWDGVWMLRSSADRYSHVESIVSLPTQTSSMLGDSHPHPQPGLDPHIKIHHDPGVSWMAQRYLEQTILYGGKKMELGCLVLLDTQLEP